MSKCPECKKIFILMGVEIPWYYPYCSSICWRFVANQFRHIKKDDGVVEGEVVEKEIVR